MKKCLLEDCGMSDDKAGEFNTGEGDSEKCLLENCGMSDDEVGEFNTRVSRTFAILLKRVSWLIFLLLGVAFQ